MNISLLKRSKSKVYFLKNKKTETGGPECICSLPAAPECITQITEEGSSEEQRWRGEAGPTEGNKSEFIPDLD